MDVTPASPGCLTGLLSFKRLALAGTGKVETRPSPTIDLHNAEAAAAGSAFRVERDRGFADSPLEGTGFEPSVPPWKRGTFLS